MDLRSTGAQDIKDVTRQEKVLVTGKELNGKFVPSHLVETDPSVSSGGGVYPKSGKYDGKTRLSVSYTSEDSGFGDSCSDNSVSSSGSENSKSGAKYLNFFLLSFPQNERKVY